MKKIDHPYLFTLHQYGKKDVTYLNWIAKDIFICVSDFDEEKNNLGDYLKANIETFNVKLHNKDRPLLTLELIDELYYKYLKYEEFKNKINVFEVAKNLKYNPCTDYPDAVHNYFERYMDIQLYEPDYFNMIFGKYTFGEYELDGYDFITINDIPAVVFTQFGKLTVIDDIFNNLVKDILNMMTQIKMEDLQKQIFDGNTFRFPEYYEVDENNHGDDQYIALDDNGKFVKFNPDIHPHDEKKFIKLRSDQ